MEDECGHKEKWRFQLGDDCRSPTKDEGILNYRMIAEHKKKHIYLQNTQEIGTLDVEMT